MQIARNETHPPDAPDARRRAEAIDTARRQADPMREYRASPIAHAVTGKHDVRAAAERTGIETSHQ